MALAFVVANIVGCLVERRTCNEPSLEKGERSMNGSELTIAAKISAAMMSLMASARKAVDNERGQGTSEYAIVVGVIVVAAVVAVLLFGDQLSTLWTTVTGKMQEVLTATA